MGSEGKNERVLEDVKIHVKIKLSALWASVMFLFAYVDIMGKYEPGHSKDAVELFLLALIIWYAVKWPKQEG